MADGFMIPMMTIFSIWSLCWVIVRNILTTLSILRVEGCRLTRIFMVWLDPVLYIITLPMFMQWSRRNQGEEDDNNDADNNPEEPQIAVVPNHQVNNAPNPFAPGFAGNQAIHAGPEPWAPLPALHPAM